MSGGRPAWRPSSRTFQPSRLAAQWRATVRPVRLAEEPPPTSRLMEPSTGKPTASLSQRPTQLSRWVWSGAAPPPMKLKPVASISARIPAGAGGETTQAIKRGWPLPVG